MKRNILLNPGPATTTDTVKQAMVVPDICPREKEFGKVMEEVSKGLVRIAANEESYTAVLFGGSGTAGVEAVLTSVGTIGNSILVVNNGAYGARMCQICEAYEIPYTEWKDSPMKELDFERLEQYLEEHHSEHAYIAMIHSETTTGIVNDIGRVGEMAKKYGLELIVDAMSSFAGIPIDMEKMNVTYLVSSSNKNIQGMAGVTFVICRKDALLSLKGTKPRNFYLNLYAQYEYFQKEYQMRFTPPVQTLYALRQAIAELEEETLEGRYARYRENWETLDRGLERLGFVRPLPANVQGPIITTVLEPEDESFSFEEMHDYLYARGFTIYPGKIGEQKTFRIANIGAIDKQDIEAFLACLEEYLTR